MPFSHKINLSAVLTVGLGASVGEAMLCDCCTPSPTVKTSTGPPTGFTTLKEETRTILVKNMCSFDLDMGFTGGYAGSAPCDDNQVKDEGGDRCFWSLGLDELLEAGQETSLLIEKNDDDDTGNDVVWSGQIYAIQSPHMDEACPGGCSASKGAAGTVTLSEFTMLANPMLTYYDISHVHGANIPTTFGLPASPKIDTGDPYRNGVAGEDCSWLFEPPVEYRKYLIEVKNAHETCSRDDECGEVDVCGASFEGEAPVYGKCGELFGYLNAHTNCIAGSLGYPFYCEVYHDLYGCAGQYGESGYSESVKSNENVCGCSDYDDLGIPSSFPCINSNPLWNDKAYKWVHYIKQGCPSAYEYAYSDSTSTFTSDSDTFELIFCPGDSEELFYA
ncbi:unnamed protein product [Ectocarpus sp. 12 AP-2014]